VEELDRLFLDVAEMVDALEEVVVAASSGLLSAERARGVCGGVACTASPLVSSRFLFCVERSEE